MYIFCGLSYASFPVVNQLTTYSILNECDNIILKDGKEISAKIIEVTPELIKYKKCENQDGPLISIYKSEILMLRYADGSKDILNINEKYQGGPAPLGFLSILCGVLAWFFLGIVLGPAALLLGIISLATEENKVFGAIGALLGLLGLIVILAAT